MSTNFCLKTIYGLNKKIDPNCSLNGEVRGVFSSINLIIALFDHTPNFNDFSQKYCFLVDYSVNLSILLIAVLLMQIQFQFVHKQIHICRYKIFVHKHKHV